MDIFHMCMKQNYLKNYCKFKNRQELLLKHSAFCPQHGLFFWSLVFRSCFNKGKSPEVPFDGSTPPYSYFEVIWIFAPIQQEAKHDQEKLSAEQKWKVCWQSPAMFCLFTHQAKIQICFTVKLISWTVVNLSHL